MPSFVCLKCGRGFDVPEATLAKFPGWSPKACLACKNQGSPRGAEEGEGAEEAAELEGERAPLEARTPVVKRISR